MLREHSLRTNVLLMLIFDHIYKREFDWNREGILILAYEYDSWANTKSELRNAIIHKICLRSVSITQGYWCPHLNFRWATNEGPMSHTGSTRGTHGPDSWYSRARLMVLTGPTREPLDKTSPFAMFLSPFTVLLIHFPTSYNHLSRWIISPFL